MGADLVTAGVPRVTLYDGNLNVIGQLATVFGVNRAYRHTVPQSVDVARIDVSRDDVLLDQLLRIDDALGRVVVIESNAYPLPWVGILESLEGDEDSGALRCVARGFEAILAQRYLSPDTTVTGNAGSIFTRLIGAANAINPTGIGIGSVDESGSALTGVQFPDSSPFDALNALAEQTGREWWLSHEVGSSVDIRAHFARRRGESVDRVLGDASGACDVTTWSVGSQESAFSVSITGGQTAVTEAYTERRRAIALPSTAAAASYRREVASSGDLAITGGRDAAFGERHGGVFYPEQGAASFVTRRHEAVVVENLKALGDLQLAAQVQRQRRPTAPRRASVTVYWQGHGSFDGLEPGNVVGLQSSRAFGGFDGLIQIVATQPMEELGFCELVVYVGERSP